MIKTDEHILPVDDLLPEPVYPLNEIRNLLNRLIKSFDFGLQEGSFLHTLIILTIVLIVVGLFDFLLRKIFVVFLPKLLRKLSFFRESGFLIDNLVSKFVRVVSVLLLNALIPLVWPEPVLWRTIFAIICNVWIVILVSQLIAKCFDAIRQNMLRSEKYRNSPFVNLFQVFKGIVYFIAILCIIAILFSLDFKSIGTGLTALSAVLMLVFKDSILGFVASIQLSNNDMVRVGDWITIPSQGVDGDVLEISLGTIKIRNFDNTVSTVPPYSLISNSVQNWRQMKESGGRRVKRAIFIDMQSIKHADEALLERLKNAPELHDYIITAVEDIERHNRERGVSDSFSRRGLTNVGIFRRYILEYLMNHEGVHKTYTCMVRQLPPADNGLPLELYFFTTSTVWVEYEGIQSDIFDHLLSVIHVFDLNIFQNVNGNSLSSCISVLSESSSSGVNE